MIVRQRGIIISRSSDNHLLHFLEQRHKINFFTEVLKSPCWEANIKMKVVVLPKKYPLLHEAIKPLYYEQLLLSLYFHLDQESVELGFFMSIKTIHRFS
jgi:hypothetical protein